MKITHYLYNAFIIESGNKKIAIDPGGLFFYWFRFTSLIPKPEWKSITHIFVTHGDPDHHWHTDRVAQASNAPVICNKTMLSNINGKLLMLAPRSKGLAFTTGLKDIHCLSVGETINVDGISVTGIESVHGELTLKIGPFSKTVKPGPEERIGWGAIGFDVQLDGKRIVNLGDTLFLKNSWNSIKAADVLMIPIGGEKAHNTMNVHDALRTVSIMQPKLVIPCHFNLPALFTKTYCPANVRYFKEEAEKMGATVAILRKGDLIELAD